MKLLATFIAAAFISGGAVLLADLRVNALAGFGARPPATGPTLDAETVAWKATVIANGGTFGTNSVAWADALIVALKAKSYNAKVVYLLPLLGSNLAAARVPLRDALAVGIATNVNFAGGDFTESVGLQGDNSGTKHLDSKVKASQLGSGSNGGIGYWELHWTSGDGAGVGPMGSSNSGDTTSFEIALRDSVTSFRWGDYTSNGANLGSTPTNGDYYGQRSSSTSRELFRDGSSIATNTSSDSASGISDKNIILVGAGFGSGQSDNSRMGCAYMTDGTLSSSDVADLHSLLQTYLITPTGR